MTLRRLALLVTGMLAVAHAARRSGLLCYTRRGHDPVRQPFGGFRCSVCGRSGGDLDAFHFGTGYIDPTELTYDRRNGGELVRALRFEEKDEVQH